MIIDTVRNYTDEGQPMTEVIGTVDDLPFQYFLQGTYTKANAPVPEAEATEIAEGNIDRAIVNQYISTMAILNAIKYGNTALQALSITNVAQAVVELKKIGNAVEKLADAQKKVLLFIKRKYKQ